MSAIFISYRRSGAKQTAYRLKDRLKHAFGDDSVFLDLEDIRAGARFADVISETIQQASVVLVVIGPRWLDMRDSEGQRRLDETDDWVRQEVEAALESDAKVIPVLVDGATEIDVEHLPPSIRGLADLNFAEISPRETHWEFDTDRLIDEIRRVDPSLAKRPVASQLPISNKAIWGIALIVLLIIGVASEEAMDHDAAVGGIGLALLALVLAIWAYFDVKAERVRGRSVAITGMLLGGLGTLAMIGSLPDPSVPLVEPVNGMAGGDMTAIDPNTLPATAAIPRVPAATDISGAWAGNGGMRYEVRQNGKRFSFDGFDTNGDLLSRGDGTINGDQVEFSFDSSDEGPGRGFMILSADRRSMVGSYTLDSGETIAASLSR